MPLEYTSEELSPQAELSPHSSSHLKVTFPQRSVFGILCFLQCFPRLSENSDCVHVVTRPGPDTACGCTSSFAR